MVAWHFASFTIAVNPGRHLAVLRFAVDNHRVTEVAVIKTVPIINNKGGVGKTTTTVNLAAGLGKTGRRVLVVDLDSQGSASFALGIKRQDLDPSVAAALFGKERPSSIVRETSVQGVDVMTGSLELANTDTRLSQEGNREKRLSRVISAVEDTYDAILIDCAPSTSLLTINALVAADAFIIPVSPSYLSLEGVVSLGEVVRKTRMNLGEAAPILGVLITMVNSTDEQTEAIKQGLRDHYGAKVFETEIHQDPVLEKAPTRSKSVFEYAPQSIGARDYRNLVEEVTDRIDRYGAVYGKVNQT
jgi:chromosome partitioning protein